MASAFIAASLFIESFVSISLRLAWRDEGKTSARWKAGISRPSAPAVLTENSRQGKPRHRSFRDGIHQPRLPLPTATSNSSGCRCALWNAVSAADNGRAKVIRVLFAPDWREGVPYQRLLGDALATHGVEVSYLRGYRRVLPLARLLQSWQRAHACDILHLHWPEAYYPRQGDAFDAVRRARFSTDLALATRRCALAVTAHNLHAHNRAGEPFAFHNTRSAFQRAGCVFAHSAAARDQLVTEYGLVPEKVCVIPHGDLSEVLPPVISRAEAGAQLGTQEDPVVLMFGAVEPYKGLEEAMAHWQSEHPAAKLVIVGKPCHEAYGAEIRQVAAGVANLELRLGWLEDAELSAWLSRADCVLFNYQTIFTSGAATLARGRGVPILLPERLKTVALDEPSPVVFRFQSFREDFSAQLRRALATPRSDDAARAWCEATKWEHVAALTARAYQDCLARRGRRQSGSTSGTELAK